MQPCSAAWCITCLLLIGIRSGVDTLVRFESIFKAWRLSSNQMQQMEFVSVGETNRINVLVCQS